MVRHPAGGDDADDLSRHVICRDTLGMGCDHPRGVLEELRRGSTGNIRGNDAEVRRGLARERPKN